MKPSRFRYSAADVTGQTWFEESYSTKTGRNSYSDRRDRINDPYQNVYNEFANDLSAYLVALDDAQIDTIRSVAETRVHGRSRADGFR